MPGTTRYSATFDRTYEEDDRVDPPPSTNTRRSRSQSWQANSGLDGRPYTPLGGRPPTQRSSSTDSGPSKIPDYIATRTIANTAVKAHNNPFQFVKVGSCPLYKKAEEQLKKTKEVKKQDVLKEEEEEWQSNLDSWKSRRRKMSEDVFRRQEEIKQFELEEQEAQVSQKKTKTFSEMVESRAHRGRTLSLCLLSSPLEFQDWEFENKSHKNGSCSTFTDESEENSTVNSEDEGVSLRGRSGRPAHHDNQNDHRTNGDAHIEQNGSKLETHNSDYNKLTDLTANSVQIKPKEGSYIDSGLESISSSHRAGDTPDSGSDFSQDSNSSIDCDSPRTGVNILEEFSSKSLQMSPGQEVTVKLSLLDKTQKFGFMFQGGKDAGQVLITSIEKGSKAESSGAQLGDQIITIDGLDVSSKNHAEITSVVQRGQERGEINLLLWRHSKTTNGFNRDEKEIENAIKPNKTGSRNGKSESQHYVKSIESENEMYVDDFDELQRQSELLTSSNKSEITNTNSQAQSKGNLSANKDSIKTSSAPKLRENITNGAVDDQNKNEKRDSEINTENQKKNIVKVKRVRKKGVYALDVSADPNQIPKEGIPVNFLYPLSPVTELPSPAEESKTMSSALSSNPTTPVSNSQNHVLLKETLKETEVKSNSSTFKENNKDATTAPKSVTSKTTVSSDELKSSPSDKAENKIDSTNVPSSPTVTKIKNISLESSQDEKPKVPSSPKKLKIKIKKANTSSEQKFSDSSQVTKEIPNCSTETSDLSVTNLVTDNQLKKEQTPSSLTDDKQAKLNKNTELSKKRESGILFAEANAVSPDAKKDNSVTFLSSNKTRNLSLKIDTKNDSVSLPSPSTANTKQPKTPVDENLKLPFASKKEKAKLMESNISPAETAVVVTDAKSTRSKDKADINVEILGTTRNLSVKTDVLNQSVNLDTTYPAVNAKQPRTPQDEKSKPPFNQKKEKAKPKGKVTENISSDSVQVTEQSPSTSVSCTSPVTNIVKEQLKKEVNSTSLIEDKEINRVVNKKENSEFVPKRENDGGTTTSVPEAKSTSSKSKAAARNLSLKIEKQTEFVNLVTTSPLANNKEIKTTSVKVEPYLIQKKEKAKSKEFGALTAENDKTVKETKSSDLEDKSPDNIATSPNKTRNLSLNIDAQSVNLKSPPVTTAKPPKTPQDDKLKSPFASKKEKKSKAKTLKQIPCDASQVALETFTITVSCSSPTTSSPKENLSTNEQKSLFHDKMLVSNAKENAQFSEATENGVPVSETAVGLQEKRNTNSKEKTPVINNSTLADKTKNLSLIIDAQNVAITPQVVSDKPPKTPQDEKTKVPFAQKRERSKSKEDGPSSLGITAVTQDMKTTASKDKISLINTTIAADKTRNLTLKINVQNQSKNISATSPVSNVKQPKTPLDEKSKSVAQKKENTKSKEKPNLSLATSAVCANIEKIEPQKSPCATVPSCNVVNDISTQKSNEKKECLPSEICAAKNDVTQSAMNCQEDKPKTSTLKRTRIRTKKKNTNSQKVNSPAKKNEELVNSNIDSLNIVFQSEPKNTLSENQSINIKNFENNSNRKAAIGLVSDVPPVEKVAEEMEKLILEQLEEEERAKELATELQTKSATGSSEHLLIAPPRLAEPPKEKPPPPPSTNEGNQKDSSLKRVNSTKRIKKEIHKRRSNFLGIDNADENIACNEPSIPPPPALEEILKAEMELDRQSRLKIDSASTERLTLEEKEIMQKEREIIESLESEERCKQLLNGTEDFKNTASTTPNDAVFEEDRILSLKKERKRIETERLLTDEQQQLHLLEEKQLREREEFIKKQEACKSAGLPSDSSFSVTANSPNYSKPALSPLTETKSKVSLSGTNGDGENVTSNSSGEISVNKSSECDEKDKAPEKPAVPPKPLKKKEAIRKERERLRQEQEALQREREEHRRKLMLEQEELMKHQKSHAPDAPVSRLGPLPPLVPPNFPPQLTSTMNASPNARESASLPSRSHHGTPNGSAGSINSVELMGPSIARQNRMPASRKAVQNEAWSQQKMPSVRKQNHDSLTESRYNQNHWLIQEAEMRRITELKERQRASQLPGSQTHLAEDDACSNPPRVPVIPPTHNPHLNYAVQDKMWNYGQSNLPSKKYPPPVIKEPLHTVYPREMVSQQPPTKPSRVVPMERQEQMLSVSGRKRCSHCNEELGRGAAMIIESLQLYYHIHCFQCCVCQAQLGNGSCGTDVRVRNNKLHCHNCYSNDEAGLKFSQV